MKVCRVQLGSYTKCVLLFWLVLAIGMFPAGPVLAVAQELTIAAASDLNFAFKEMVQEFEKQNGVRVKLSLGSSGNFFSQIQHGAPFDLYFSADIRFPQKLIESGHAVSGSLKKYAIGQIVLWVPKSSPLDVEKLGVQALLEASVKKVAIANPKHAPYGRAAIEALKHFKIYEQVKDKLVLGENVSQVAQFVESGAADAGIIALSLALAPSMKEAGKYWQIPASAHHPIEQGAVVIKSARNPEGAKAFLSFVGSEAGRQTMTRYGFVLPE